MPSARRVLGIAGSAGVLLAAGCGNQYRPVVSAINPVGPAGQPTKYAVAISNPNAAQTTVTGYSITGNVISVNVVSDPFTVGQPVGLSGFPTSTFLNGQTVTVTSASATQFQASFTHANTTTPAVEVALATYLGPQAGLITIVDVSGDTVLTTPQIQTNPDYFILSSAGTLGYVINAEGQLDFFAATNPGSLITSNIGQTTLTPNSGAVSLSSFSPANSGITIFVPAIATSTVSALNGGTLALYDTVAVGPNPVYVVGSDSTPRAYALSQGTTPGTSLGSAAALETATASALAVSATIPLGISPTYGVMTSDDRRAFILNKGSGTLSVINVINNALDSTTPSITIPTITSTKLVGGVSTPCTAAPNPIWAGLSPVSNELIVLNQGDGSCSGSLTIINIPLCSSFATTTNPNCNLANPADAAGFGQIVSTTNLGVNPVMVSVLQDGSTAWVANAGNTTTAGSVMAVGIASGQVMANLTGIASPATPTAATASAVYGHPNSISATTGSPTGKVYVTSADSEYMTIIYTDTNTVQNHITLQGNGLRVLVTTP